MKQKICKQVVMHDIAEGDRIYQQMKQAMLSVEPNIGSTVSMNYALSKLMANYKLMMKLLDIEVESYIGDMMAYSLISTGLLIWWIETWRAYANSKKPSGHTCKSVLRLVCLSPVG